MLYKPKMKKNSFWDGFFFVFGFNSNPISEKLKETARKNVDQRISESWDNTSSNFKDVFDSEACLLND
jgi:hypothetical protein